MIMIKVLYMHVWKQSNETIKKHGSDTKKSNKGCEFDQSTFMYRWKYHNETSVQLIHANKKMELKKEIPLGIPNLPQKLGCRWPAWLDYDYEIPGHPQQGTDMGWGLRPRLRSPAPENTCKVSTYWPCFCHCWSVSGLTSIKLSHDTAWFFTLWFSSFPEASVFLLDSKWWDWIMECGKQN
jgi:hypothetical protein